MTNSLSETNVSRWDDLPTWQGHIQTYRLQVARERIGYVNAIFEGYEDISRVMTENITRGIVVVGVVSDWDDVFHRILESISHKIDITVLEGADAPFPKVTPRGRKWRKASL